MVASIVTLVSITGWNMRPSMAQDTISGRSVARCQGDNGGLTAEELLQLAPGADYGWPECYYDQRQKKLVLAPEYGGDGGKTEGVCAQRRGPVAAFPGHWAPNDLAIYHGTQFPAGYRGGAFIAFHGSWNRAPLAQQGYNVVFQPLADGKAADPFCGLCGWLCWCG
jgi:glucose/arabinose dehydrogenase